MDIIPIVITVSGLVILASCQPLIRRKVPMNHFYGIRVPAAFESNQQWYEINEYGGRKLGRWSWIIMATGILGMFIPAQHAVTYAWASTPVVLMSLTVPIVQTMTWAE